MDRKDVHGHGQEKEDGLSQIFLTKRLVSGSGYIYFDAIKILNENYKN
ncbi:MAG: hypothetical protein ACT4N1_05350 [Nitrososphaerota archaeon]